MSSEQFYAQSRALGKVIGFGLHGLGLSLILAAAVVSYIPRPLRYRRLTVKLSLDIAGPLRVNSNDGPRGTLFCARWAPAVCPAPSADRSPGGGRIKVPSGGS